MKQYYLEVQCIVCGKELIRGDYIYGACHKCTKIAIDRMVKGKDKFIDKIKEGRNA